MKKIVVLISSILFLTELTCFASNNIEWQQVAPDSYINPDGIIGVDDIYGFSFMLKSYNKGQYEPVRGESIQYTIAQYTIDCTNLTYKIGVIDSYGADDNFVNGDYNRYAKFRPIVSGTAVSTVASKLCRMR